MSCLPSAKDVAFILLLHAHNIPCSHSATVLRGRYNCVVHVSSDNFEKAYQLKDIIPMDVNTHLMSIEDTRFLYLHIPQFMNAPVKEEPLMDIIPFDFIKLLRDNNIPCDSHTQNEHGKYICIIHVSKENFNRACQLKQDDVDARVVIAQDTQYLR